MKEKPLTWFLERIGSEVDRYHPDGDLFVRSGAVAILDQKTAEWFHKSQSDSHQYRYTENLFTNPLNTQQ